MATSVAAALSAAVVNRFRLSQAPIGVARPVIGNCAGRQGHVNAGILAVDGLGGLRRPRCGHVSVGHDERALGLPSLELLVRRAGRRHHFIGRLHRFVMPTRIAQKISELAPHMGASRACLPDRLVTEIFAEQPTQVANGRFRVAANTAQPGQIMA